VTVLVTGATGFVGSHVVRQLVEAGVETTALVRPGASMDRLAGTAERIEILEADLSDSATVGEKLGRCRPDACIHLAWFAEPGKYLEAADNIDSLRSSLALLEDLARVGCRHVVAAGTCAEYAFGAEVLTEDTPTKPTTLYAATKLAFNLVAAQRCAQLGMGMAWARLFYLYGPYEDKRRLVPAVINALLASHEFPTTAGEQIRDYLHVEDVASALCSLSRRNVTGAFNVCSGEPVTIAALMQTLGELLGRPELIRLGALPYRQWEPMFVCGDNHRLRTEAGWAPRHSLRGGLASTAEWWKGAR
jgi:nucleoside-diphosphate-sugar epimerase